MSNFSEAQKKAAWSKAKIINEGSKDSWRKDPCGAWISWSKYGNADNLYGWQIDHIYPKDLIKANQNADDPTNLWAMQSENNNRKSNDYPVFTAAVTSGKNSKGESINIKKEVAREISKSTQATLKKLYNIK